MSTKASNLSLRGPASCCASNEFPEYAGLQNFDYFAGHIMITTRVDCPVLLAKPPERGEHSSDRAASTGPH